jgi:hypothetical protein
MGWLIVRQFGAVLPHWLERVIASFVLGTGIVGGLAFVLAEFGLLSLPLLGAIWLVLVLFLAWCAHRRDPFSRIDDPPGGEPLLPILPFLPSRLEHALLLSWLVAAVWLFFRPHQFVIGAADAGVYVNLAASIADTGRVLVAETVLDDVPAELARLFVRELDTDSVAPYIPLPGFYAFDVPTGELTPQFYHLHPVWQALAYRLGGVQAALMITGLWALAGALAIYLTVRQFAGWQVAALALAGLTVNALQVWFARYPTTEAMSQFYLWAGFWGTSGWLARRAPQRLWALLGGISLGLFFLVRIDAVIIVPALVLLGLWIALSGYQRETAVWYFLPAAGLLLHSLLHGYWQSRPYFLDLYGFAFALLRSSWWLGLVALAVGGALVWLLIAVRGRLHRLKRLRPWLLGAFVAGFLIYAVYGWFIRPVVVNPADWLDPYSESPIPVLDHENWPRLAWYLSPIGVGLGVVGICLLLWRVERRTALWLGVGLFFAVFFLWRIRANPHQIYAMRRYVPAVMPLFVLGGAYATGWLAPRRRPWSTAMALFLALAWLGGLAWSARGFVRQVDYRGLLAQLEQLNVQIEPDAILLFNDPQPITQGDIVGTPLRFLFGHDVLSVREPTAGQMALLEAAISRWMEEGRSVYWIQIPTAQMALTPAIMSYVTTYRLETTQLEWSYDHRPQAIQPVIWSGDLYLVLEPEGARR